MIVWIAATVFILTDRHDTLTYAATLCAALFMMISAVLLSHENKQALRGFEAPLIGYAVICIIFLTAGWTALNSFEGNRKEMAQVIENMNFIPVAFVLACARPAGICVGAEIRPGL